MSPASLSLPLTHALSLCPRLFLSKQMLKAKLCLYICIWTHIYSPIDSYRVFINYFIVAQGREFPDIFIYAEDRIQPIYYPLFHS